MIIATAGHVDHGKTTLIRALTGIDTDRLPEEKQRGMSIDLGFAYANFDGVRVGFVDVPGHERFIRNMLAGVGGIDFALLVIAADDGVMPQTREHLAILDLLGIQNGVVAITKIDRAGAERLDALIHEVRSLIDCTTLKASPVIPVSAQSDSGITHLRGILTDAAKNHPLRKRSGNFRLAIDRVFSLRGIGITLTGTVFSGEVKTGDMLKLSPSGIQVRVRSIHANDQPTDYGARGQRCAINITGAAGDSLDKDAIHRGDWLLSPLAHCPTRRFDARIHVLRSEPESLKHWQPVHVHSASAHTPGRIALLEGSRLLPGVSGLAQVVLDRTLGVLHGDRFIVRDAGSKRTLAGGVVLDPFAPGKGRARADRIAILHALESATPIEALNNYLDISPDGIDLFRLFQAFNLSPEETAALIPQINMLHFGRGQNICAIRERYFTALCARIPDALANWHLNHPQSLGPDAQALLRNLGSSANTVILNAALKQLLLDGTIVRSGSVLHLPEHSVSLLADDTRMWDKLLAVYLAANLVPPRIRELAEEFSAPPELMEALLVRLTQAGLLSHVTGNRFFMPQTLYRLARIAENTATTHEGAFTAKDYRQASGIGRNLTIEVLEYFDRAGFTRRVGLERIIICPANDVFGE